LNELGDVQDLLEDDDLDGAERVRLVKLVAALEDKGEGWADWIRLEGVAGLPNFMDEAQTWLASDIEWGDYEWFPKYTGAQGHAMEFFESLPFETLKAIGVVIVEVDHPGSTYYAAELSTSIELANVRVAELELPFRFKKEGSDAEDLELIGALHDGSGRWHAAERKEALRLFEAYHSVLLQSGRHQGPRPCA